MTNKDSLLRKAGRNLPLISYLRYGVRGIREDDKRGVSTPKMAGKFISIRKSS